MNYEATQPSIMRKLTKRKEKADLGRSERASDTTLEIREASQNRAVKSSDRDALMYLFSVIRLDLPLLIV